MAITNSCAAGTAWRPPVIISGCCFEGDGTNVPGGGGPSAAMGTPFVSARAAGSFTVQSTSDTGASTVAWMIM